MPAMNYIAWNAYNENPKGFQVGVLEQWSNVGIAHGAQRVGQRFLLEV